MKAKNSMAEQITTALRQDVIVGRYADDAVLTELEISQKYASSKTPAREALNQLCAEGLLEKIPHKGYFVRKFSVSDVESLLQFRYVLETQGVEISKQTMTKSDLKALRKFCDECAALSDEEVRENYVSLNRQFHVMLISCTKNRYMTDALENLMNQLKVALAEDSVLWEPQLSAHEAVIDALESGDFEQAKLLVGNSSSVVIRRLGQKAAPWRR